MHKLKEFYKEIEPSFQACYQRWKTTNDKIVADAWKQHPELKKKITRSHRIWLSLLAVWGVVLIVAIFLFSFNMNEENYSSILLFLVISVLGLGVTFWGGLCYLIFSVRSFGVKKVNFYDALGESLKLHHTEGGALPLGIQEAQRLGFIIPDVEEVQDSFTAQQKGADVHIEVVEWEIQNTDKDDEVRSHVYNGFIVSYRLRTPVKGTTILTADDDWAKRHGKKQQLKRVELEWIEFEKTFDLFTTNEQEAREIMAPDVMSVLYDFYKMMGEPGLCFVFHDKEISCFYPVDEVCPVDETGCRCAFQILSTLQKMPDFLGQKMAESDWDERQRLQQERAAKSPNK